MKFGKPSKSAPNVHANKGKGGVQALLPNRAAMNKIIKGTPDQGLIGNYAKFVPSGANAAPSYNSIIQMGEKAPKLDE
jgi:hypothetical protein